MPIISVTLPSDNTSANVADYNVPITTILSTLNGGLDDDNIASLSGTKVIADTLPQSALTAAAKNGWITGVLPAQSGTITNNGQGSYDIPFASTVAGILSPQMKLQVVRTTTASTYMGGAFNGTNHYFTKVTPTSTLSTITNNFSIRAVIEPTAYSLGYIEGRGDTTSANGLFLRMNADGTISCGVSSGGAGNFRVVATRQSVPLNKKTKIWATWTSGTVVIYFDGIAVPVAAATTGGTAPTTAGTGGDFSIGRWGALNASYFTGYISDCAVFNAVLSQATIRSLDSQPLLGSESNCIGAWSLNNTGVNQQASGTNDVTATNSVGYTSGRSAYGTDGNGVSAGTTDVALIMAVSTSTITVQVPEGCTIPTSGGITSISHSTDANPFGWVADRNRWEILALMRNLNTQSSPVANTWYNLTTTSGTTGGNVLTVPVGLWDLGYVAVISASTATASTAASPYITLSTTNNGETDTEFTSRAYTVSGGSTAAGPYLTGVSRRRFRRLTSATPYYLNNKVDISNQTALEMYAGNAPTIISAIPAGI